MKTLMDEEMNDIINDILSTKDEIRIKEDDLEDLKNRLISKMTNTNKYEFNGEYGTAKIISYIRESLMKDEVLMTFDKVNSGRFEGRINTFEHIKKSPVYFVLVKGKE